MDDGVLWVQGAAGRVRGPRRAGRSRGAGRHPRGRHRARAGRTKRSSARSRSRTASHGVPPAPSSCTTSSARSERRPLELTVKPLSQGNVSLFYYLSLVGFFSLLVGTIVMLRRPPDRAALHFYAICLLFFLMYSTSYTGKLNLADWTLLWTDTLSILFLPVVFLHFCLAFPERRLATTRAWIIPAAYMPALALAGAAVASQVLFVTSPPGASRGPVARSPLSSTTGSRSTSRPCSRSSFGILLGSYRRTRSLTARKQMKWLVLGHRRRRDAVLPLLRDPVRARPRAAPGHGAGRVHPAGPHPALAGLRGGQAPA